MKTIDNLLDNDALDINSTYPGIMAKRGQIILCVMVVLFLSILYVVPYNNKVHIEAVFDPSHRLFSVNYDSSIYSSSIIYLPSRKKIFKGSKIATFKYQNHIEDIYAPFTGWFYIAKNDFKDISINLIEIQEFKYLPIYIDNKYQINSGSNVILKVDKNVDDLKGFIYSIQGSKRRAMLLISLLPNDLMLFKKIRFVNNYAPLKISIDIVVNKTNALAKMSSVLYEKFTEYRIF